MKKRTKLTALLAAASTTVVLGGAMATVVGCAKQTDDTNSIITIEDYEVNKQATNEGKAKYSFAFAGEERPDDLVFRSIHIVETKIETKDEKKQRSYLEVNNPKSVVVNKKGNFDVDVVFKDEALANIMADTKVTFNIEFTYTVNGEVKTVIKSGLTVKYTMPVVETDTIVGYNKIRTTTQIKERFYFKFIGVDGFIPQGISNIKYVSEDKTKMQCCMVPDSFDIETGSFAVDVWFDEKPTSSVDNKFDLAFGYVKERKRSEILVKGYEYHFQLPQPEEKDSIAAIGQTTQTVGDDLSATYEFAYTTSGAAYPNIQSVEFSDSVKDILEVKSISSTDQKNGHFKVSVKYKQTPTSNDEQSFKLTFNTTSLKYQTIKLDTELTIKYNGGEVTGSVLLLSNASQVVTANSVAYYTFEYAGNATQLTATFASTTHDVEFVFEGSRHSSLQIDLAASKQFIVAVALKNLTKEEQDKNWTANFTISFADGSGNKFVSPSLSLVYYASLPKPVAQYDMAQSPYQSILPQAGDPTNEMDLVKAKQVAVNLLTTSGYAKDQFYLAHNDIYQSLENKPANYNVTIPKDFIIKDIDSPYLDKNTILVTGSFIIDQAFKQSNGNDSRLQFNITNFPLTVYYDNGWKAKATPALVTIPGSVESDSEKQIAAQLQDLFENHIDQVGLSQQFVISNETTKEKWVFSHFNDIQDWVNKFQMSYFDAIKLFENVSFNLNVLSPTKYVDIITADNASKVINTPSTNSNFVFNANRPGIVDIEITNNTGAPIGFNDEKQGFIQKTSLEIVDPITKGSTIQFPFVINTIEEKATANFSLKITYKDTYSYSYYINNYTVNYEYKPYVEKAGDGLLNYGGWESDSLSANFKTNINVRSTPLNVALVGNTDKRITLPINQITKSMNNTINVPLEYSDAILLGEELPIQIRIWNDDIDFDQTFKYTQKFFANDPTQITDPKETMYKAVATNIVFNVDPKKIPLKSIGTAKINAEVVSYEAGEALMHIDDKGISFNTKSNEIIIPIQIDNPGDTKEHEFIIRIYGTFIDEYDVDHIVRFNHTSGILKIAYYPPK